MPLACIHIRCGCDARDWSLECARPYLSLVHTSNITSFLVHTCTWCGSPPIIRAAWAMPILICIIPSPSLFLSSLSYLPLPSGVRGYTGCLPTLMGGYGRLPGHWVADWALPKYGRSVRGGSQATHPYHRPIASQCKRGNAGTCSRRHAQVNKWTLMIKVSLALACGIL